MTTDKNKIPPGTKMAFYANYGRGTLGEDRGVVKVTLLDMKPKLKRVHVYSKYGSSEAPQNNVYVATGISEHVAYGLAGDGDETHQVGGVALVEMDKDDSPWGPPGILVGKKLIKVCVEKRKLLGTWEEHLKAKDERENGWRRQQEFEKQLKTWRQNARKTLMEYLGARGIEPFFTNDQAEFTLEQLAQLLKIDIGQRPEK